MLAGSTCGSDGVGGLGPIPQDRLRSAARKAAREDAVMPKATSPLDPKAFEYDHWVDAWDPRVQVRAPLVAEHHPLWRLFCPRPTVRILFYTDDFSVAFDDASDFGVSLLRDLIVDHSPFYATFQIDLLNRHQTGHASKPLTASVLAGYDQVWFFGVGQANTRSEPANELTSAEVGALNAWMATGGVLISGDHANMRPAGADPSLNALVNLGRAIGHRVPRAGELRRWEGPPGASAATNHNTQVKVGTTSVEDLSLQRDAVPQEIILKRYSLPTIMPAWFYRSQPHPLFCGRMREITVFPDHMHEGQIEIPLTFPVTKWPSVGGVQPTPEVVAWGVDKRNGNVYPVVAAYDGQRAGVGRIVADSTWHHYFNVNLVGFLPGSQVLNDIADYFVNLSVWLTPAPKREQMKCWFWWWVVLEPTVLMARSQPFKILGAAARDVIDRVATQCQITEFLGILDLKPEILARVPLPPDDLLIGGIVHEYHEAIQRLSEKRGRQRVSEPRELRRRGLIAAIEDAVNELKQSVDGSRQLLAQLQDKAATRV